MDEDYLLAAARYIGLNPVRAKSTVDPGESPWGSVAAHRGLWRYACGGNHFAENGS